MRGRPEVPADPAQGDPAHTRTPPMSGGGPRTRRTAAEKAAARDRVLADRTTVITRYTRGDSLKAIARTYDVHAPWLAARLTRWGVPVRTHAHATSHTHVHRDGATGAVTAIRCPDPHCGRKKPCSSRDPGVSGVA